MTDDWRRKNLANWESRVPIHLQPDGYDLVVFDDPAHLSDVVRYDLPRLGRLDGLHVVHLQCHLGTDTVSLARLGARSTTGLDFSPSAIDAARGLAVRAVTDTRFVTADVYDASDVLGTERFDLVYTGIGALCWLPDIARWAKVVAQLLRPGGRLFLREGHPVVWALGYARDDGAITIEYPYFETAGTAFDEPGTYAGSGDVASPTTIQFNHGIAEILNAVAAAGMRLDSFVEHCEIPWTPLDAGFEPSPIHPGEYVLSDRPERLPLTYTLQATKL